MLTVRGETCFKTFKGTESARPSFSGKATLAMAFGRELKPSEWSKVPTQRGLMASFKTIFELGVRAEANEKLHRIGVTENYGEITPLLAL